MKIVVLDGYAGNPGDLSWEEFSKYAEVVVYDRTKKEEILERMSDAEIVLTNKAIIGKEEIEKSKKLKYIGIIATGVNIVDLAAAKENGIIVSNVPAYCVEGMAQHTFAFILEICNQVGHHSNEVHKGRWVRSQDFTFSDKKLISLNDKTLGIIGLGNIGIKVAEIAKVMGMNVLTSGSRETEKGRELAKYVSLNELLENSDIISIHCPLTSENKGLINKENIEKMKDGVVLINTARGPIINEQDLANALASGKIYAAGLDVVSVEPMEADSPLLNATNCFITPHIGWAQFESREKLMKIVLENIVAFLDGKPQNVVNS